MTKAIQIAATSAEVNGELMVTIIALLDNGDIVYTGLADSPEWHMLPRIRPTTLLKE